MAAIKIDKSSVFVHAYSANDEEAVCIRVDTPKDDEETCVITMDPIGHNGEAVGVAFENLPGMSVAELPCLHRFNCIALITHFVSTGMHCPICRHGPRALMQRCSVNEPWITSLVADVANKRRVQLMQQIHEDENIAEEMFRNESGIYPFTTTITFIARSVGGGLTASSTAIAHPVPGPAELEQDAAGAATGEEDAAIMNFFFVEGIDPGVVVSTADEAVGSEASLAAAPAMDAAPGIVFGGHSITLQLGSPVVTVEMIACVYLYTEDLLTPRHAVEVQMQRINVDERNQGIEFNTQLHDLRALSRLVDESQASHIRVVTGYLRLFGGIERVAVSRRIPLFGSEQERALLQMTPPREGRHGRTHSAMGAQIGTGVFLVDTFIQTNASQQWVCVLDRLAFRLPLTNQGNQATPS